VKARSLSLLTCTYVGTIDCKLPSIYVGEKCYSLVIAFIIKRTYSILRVIKYRLLCLKHNFKKKASEGVLIKSLWIWHSLKVIGVAMTRTLQQQQKTKNFQCLLISLLYVK
jgi:hypothetical protein